MAPRKAGKRVETEVVDIPEILENNDATAAKKKKIHTEEQISKEGRLPRAAKNKKVESDSIQAKAVTRQKTTVKKTDSLEKKSLGKNSTKKVEIQVDDTEKVEKNEEIIEKPVKKSRGKAEKKLNVPMEKNFETNVKGNAHEEKAASLIKKSKVRSTKTEGVSKKARTKKHILNEIDTPKSNIIIEDNEKEIKSNIATKENGIEVKALENGKEELLQQKIEIKLVKKGKGKISVKKGKTASKSKVVAETNGDNKEDTANELEIDMANNV